MSKINERIEREKQFHDVRYSNESTRRQKVSNSKEVFLETLKDNFFINLYRRLTATITIYLKDEHPLLEKDLAISRSFKQTKIHYFYLTSLAAYFMVGKARFKTLLRCCKFIDSIVLNFPGIIQPSVVSFN